ncbi:MAG TPA: PspC domain-containing protein [Mucilaginibacter sp.]|jgi:phage shock protein PspC (stress-responsive transcriptional regulator)|nr:PspC domain-containing protein [Mucilaginibacter sp.]
MEKKLQRDTQHKMIAGVCAGLADYLNMDVTLVRVLFLVTLIFHGSGLIPYLVLWAVLPKKAYSFGGPQGFNTPPQSFNNPNVDYTVPSQPYTDYSVPPQSVMPPKKASNASIIVGIALVAFGSFFLLDEFDIIPDWQFDRLWPVLFIIGGVVMVFSRRKQQPWEKAEWHATEEPTAETKTETPTEDTPPTV